MLLLQTTANQLTAFKPASDSALGMNSFKT